MTFLEIEPQKDFYKIEKALGLIRAPFTLYDIVFFSGSLLFP
ncbi:MAG: hypothetical protein ACJASQ_001558 [Crocinitomicaceae bacterium]|jgi:hypothetical protein